MEIGHLMQLLKSVYAIRKFSIAVGIGLLVLIAARLWPIEPLLANTSNPWLHSIGQTLEVLDIEAIAAVLSAAFLVGFFLWTTPAVMARAAVTAVSPYEIRDTLLDGLRTTSEYWFRGRSGRFLRSQVLPALSSDAASQMKPKSLYVLVPDPNAATSLREYARHRNSQAVPGDGRWDEARVRNEIMATVLTAAKLAADNSLINVEIGFLPSFGSLRFDVSASSVILTREHPKWPALKCDADSIFYNMFREELRTSLEQSTKVSIDKNTLHRISISEETFPACLEALNMRVEGITESDIRQIVSSINDPHDPYEPPRPSS